jgi:antitoxin component of RelBE/YafQ-DinJ toxin-antitoxin module
MAGKQAETTKPLYIRLDNFLKARVVAQCDRLGVSQAAITKMALTRFLEEEEKLEDKNKIYSRGE